MSVFKEAIAKYRKEADQDKAIQWLQASTGTAKQAEFSRIWRKGAVGDLPISLVNVFRFYSGLEHQDKALIWLEANTVPAALKEFLRLYEKASKPKEIRLAVPFFAQTDNRNQPERTCNSSSCAMVAEFLKPGIIKGSDDYYWEKFVNPIGDTTSHAVQTKALAKLGIKSEFETSLDFDDLDRSLEKGLPVVISILHRGSLTAPRGGHVLVVIGRTAIGDYIVNDPFGSVNNGYTGPVIEGKGAIYQRKMLEYRWLSRGAGKSGWGRLFQH